MKRSQIFASSSSREPAEQVWPAFCTIALTTEASAASKSASANTICGDLPPSSSVQPMWLRAAAVCTAVPTSGLPVNEMKSTPGWAASAAPASSPRPGTTLSAPSGKPRLRREFGEPQRREAGVFGRLHHAGVADRKRGGDRAPEHLARVVPGDDVAGHALRLVDGGDEIAVEERDRVAVQLVGGAAVIFEIARDRDRVGARLSHRLAGVARLERGDLVDVVLDRAAEFRQQAPAFGGAEPAPGALLERASRGGDREVDVARVARRDGGEGDAFSRRDHRQRAAGDGGAPSVVDEHAFGGRRGDGLIHGRLLKAGEN